MIKYIKSNRELLAIIVKKNLKKRGGVNFCTPDNFNIQFGFINHERSKVIQPHLHFNKKIKKIFNTSEVLYIIEGKLRVDFYNKKKKYLFSRILSSGDTIMLINQGHGFKTLKKTIMLEVKQGPYLRSSDKIKFNTIDEKHIKIKV